MSNSVIELKFTPIGVGHSHSSAKLAKRTATAPPPLPACLCSTGFCNYFAWSKIMDPTLKSALYSVYLKLLYYYIV